MLWVPAKKLIKAEGLEMVALPTEVSPVPLFTESNLLKLKFYLRKILTSQWEGKQPWGSA